MYECTANFSPPYSRSPPSNVNENNVGERFIGEVLVISDHGTVSAEPIGGSSGHGEDRVRSMALGGRCRLGRCW